MQAWLFKLAQTTRRLGPRVGLQAALSLLAVAATPLLGRYVPSDWTGRLGENAVDSVLTLLASAMLPVATFSMATIVAAHTAVLGNASPRAAALLMQDKSALRAVSIFLGAFVYSLLALIGLATGQFGAGARLVLFLLTLFVVAWVIVRLVTWVDAITRMVRVRDAVRRVESEFELALRDHEPLLGGAPAGPVPLGAQPVRPTSIGYVQMIDVDALQSLAERHGLVLQLALLPGAFTRLSQPLMHVVEGEADEDVVAKLRKAFVVAQRRDFRQDPRFGLVVLGEIASRALSPGINDPGTAIDSVGAAVRALSHLGEHSRRSRGGIRCGRVRVPPLSADDAFEDVFRPIARDGRAFVEVHIALQHGLEELARIPAEGFADAARRQSRQALARAEQALPLEDDRNDVRAVAAWSG